MKTFITVLIVSVLYAIPALAMEATVVSNYSYFQQAGSNSLPDTTNKQELLKKVRERGWVRVIITYDNVEYNFPTNEAQRNMLAQEIETMHSRLLDEINARNLNVSGIKKSRYAPRVSLSVNKEALEYLYKVRMIKEISEDRVSRLHLTQSIPIVEADAAWEGLEITGDGETIVILDTGVDYTHEMLSGKVIDGACFSTNDVGNHISSLCPNGQEAEYGIAAGGDCGNANGCNHGTHVAGIAAGNGTNLKGVANGADIISIQVFSLMDAAADCDGNAPCIGSFISDQLEALEWLYTNYSLDNTISAVNMSLGDGQFSSVCDGDQRKNAIDGLLSRGILTVISSGNEGYSNALSAPACISSAISVGATNDQDVHWSVSGTEGSNAASFLDLVAPGVSINSSVPGGYSSMTGTSMAAPHVAGTVALMKEAYPNLLTSNYRSILQNSADDVSAMFPFTFTDEYGHGRLNTFKAVAEALKYNPSVGVFDYDYTYNSSQTVQFRDQNIYILPGYTLTVHGEIELYNSNIYVLGTLEGNGQIDLFGESDIYERLDGENNFMGDTTHYGDVYPVVVRNDFSGYYGGQIGVGVNATPVSKSSPDTVFVSDGNTLNLAAYDNQTWNGYTWVFNDSEGSTNKSRWYRQQNGQTSGLNDSYNQSPSHEVDENQGAVIYNVQKRKFTITRNDYSPELGGNINSANVTVIEGNTLSAPASHTDNGIKYTFYQWSDGETDRARTISTPTSPLTAHYKAVGHSNDSNAFTNNSQRRMVQTTSGSMPGYEYWLYRVYTSMGHVWMEYSWDRGATWKLGNGGKPLDGGAGGKNPSIDYYYDEWDNMNYIGVVWQQPHNNTYKIQGMMFNQAADVVQDPQSQYATTIYTEPSDAYSVDANPNVVLTGGAHSFYVVSIERKSSSGNWDAGIHLLVGTISDIGTVWAGPFDLYEKHAKIAQTNASTTNVQMSLVPGTPNTLNLIRQQGTSGPIYSELIGVSRSSGGLITISQASDGVISYPSLSTKPSIVSFSDYYFSACWIEAYDMVYFNLISPSVLYYFGDFANSCSINRGGGAGTNGFVVWSQNPYSGRTNKSIRFTNGLPESSTITTLTTSGQYVQVGNGTTSNLSHMYVTAFYPFTAPYHFQTSSALGPASKAGQVEIAEGRGFFLRNGAASFSYRFSGLNVDGVHIPFVDVPEKYDYGNLEHLNNTLLTEPFQVHAASEIAFNERVGFADSSASAAKAMGRDGFIRYRLELIEEGTAKSAGTLREENFTSSTIRKSQSRTYAVNPAGLEGKVVRAKITVETNQVKTEKASALPDAFPEEVQRARLNKRRSTNLVLTRHYSEVNEARPKPDVEQLTVLQDTPDSYNLSQNYPNPFNPSTIIRYQLPSNENIRLEVFDLLGRKVSTLVNERQSAGHYSVTFDASHLASGFYIYRLRAGDFIQSKKLFLVK